MNCMNILVESSLNGLRKLFTDIGDERVTVIVTGSIARGDERYSGKELESDMDVLLIVREKENINELKEKIKRTNITNLGISISLVFTLFNSFKKNGSRGFVQPITNDYILYDGLGISDYFDNKELRGSIELENFFQELTYYYSKYRHESAPYLKDKILKIWNKITKNEGSKVFPSIEDISEMVLKERIYLLPSTVVFLEYISILYEEELYKLIRNLVFIENQGLSFEESYFSI